MFEKLKIAWQSRSTLGDEKLQTQELDFLPAALEIHMQDPLSGVVLQADSSVRVDSAGVILAEQLESILAQHW